MWADGVWREWQRVSAAAVVGWIRWQCAGGGGPAVVGAAVAAGTVTVVGEEYVERKRKDEK